MNRFINFFAGVFVGAIVLTACSNEDVMPQNGQAEVEPVEYFNITYEGKTYKNVATMYDENGEFVFFDADFSRVYKAELANNKEWSINMTGEKDMVFYKNLQANLQANGIKLDSSVPVSEVAVISQTRAGYEDLAYLTLYDDRNFKDRNYSFYLNDSTIYTEVSNLKNSPWKFNDKCSSLVICNNLPNNPNIDFQLGYFKYPCSEIDAVFVGYDDRSFSDRTITCIAHPAEKKKHSSLPDFNDKLSSFKFFFAQKGQYITEF